MFFHYNYLYGHALASETLTQGHKILNFVRPFLGHHCYVLSLFDQCMEVKTEILKEIMHFHYETNTICPGGSLNVQFW